MASETPQARTPLHPTVLCVDDEDIIRDVLTRALQRQEMLVETATDGFDAWDRISRDLGRFDLVITDNQMPNVSGLELVQLLREANYPGKVVFFSSTLGPRDAAVLAQLRVDAVIEKGTDLTRLLAEIDRVLGAR